MLAHSPRSDAEALPREPRAWRDVAAASALLLPLLLVAFALRLHNLGYPNLTGDEWFMLRNYDEGPLWIIRQARNFEPHPLLYYLSFWAWVGLVGHTEFAMRFLSAAFGMVTVAGMFALGRCLLGTRAGLLVAALATVNPYQIAQSQNARDYAPATALALLSTLALVLALRRSDVFGWWRYLVATLMALNTHYEALLLLLPQGLYVLIQWRRGQLHGPTLRRWLRAQAALALFFGAWMLYAWPALAGYPGYFPEPVTPPQIISRTLTTFSLGQLATPHLPRAAAAALVLLALLGFASGWARRRDAALLGVLWLAVPLTVMAPFFLVRPMFEERYLVVLTPGYLLLLAVGLEWLSGRGQWLGAAGTTAVLALTLLATLDYYSAVPASRPDYRAMAAWIRQHSHNEDVIVTTSQGRADVFSYYWHGGLPVRVASSQAELDASLDSSSDRPHGVWFMPYTDLPFDQEVHRLLVEQGYSSAVHWFNDVSVRYFWLPAGAEPTPQQCSATWAGHIALHTCLLGLRRVKSGEFLPVALYWQVLGAVHKDYKVSLRLVGDDGHSVSQIDRRPADGLRPFAAIRPGAVVRDAYALLVPRTAAPGPYHLEAVVYNAADLQPLDFAPRRANETVGSFVGEVQVVQAESAPASSRSVVPLGQPLVR